MEIKPVDLSVKQLLTSDFYKIPRFQRPYSWDRANVEDFWNDAIAADVPDYFIGSFVVYRGSDPHGPLFIVDGQQRLTTITLLLAAVRDALDTAGFPGRAKGVQQLIEHPDINAEQQFVLQTETSYPYLQEHIQKHGKPSLLPKLGDEEAALKEAYDFLKRQLQNGLAEVDAKVKSPEERSKRRLSYLLRARDQLLRLQLIQIKLTKEDEAYLIFETLNTRGKDLTVSDLAKNYLARLMKPKNKGVDVHGDKWTAILETLEASKADLDVNRFLHHSWLSRRPFVGEKQLFSSIKLTIAVATAADYLEALVNDSGTYRTVFEPEYHRGWSKPDGAIIESLRALQVFRVMQPAPMLLAILRSYFAGKLSRRQAAGVLRQMEHFHLQFTALTAQRTGGGTAKMYAFAGRSLCEAVDKNKAAQVLRDFLAKLRERVPSEAEFAAAFAQLRFSDENTKQKALVRYVLTRIDMHFRRGAPVDYSKFTIEHIAPQSPMSGPPEPRFAEIGNLVLVPEVLNSQLGNDAFPKKKLAMLSEGVPLDDVLKRAAKWGDAQIGERSAALATLAYKKIFTV